MSYSPVVVFVYNRLKHVKEALSALNENDYAELTELFIFSDMYDENKVNEQEVMAVRKYIQIFSENCRFKNVNIILAKEHRGLARSVISGVTDIITRYGKVIVVEDDLVTAKSFLRYMNEALDYYKDNKRVWSISGYSLPMFSLRRCKSDVFAGYRGSSWGWATWKDRWDMTDWDVSDYKEFISSEQKKKEFNKGGEDMSDLLTMQMEGKSDSWAIRWNYQQYKEDMLSIFPVKSQVKNLGFDGSGRNCRKSILNIYDTTICNLGEHIRFEDCEIDERIMKEMRREYSKSLVQRFLLIISKRIGKLYL